MGRNSLWITGLVVSFTTLCPAQNIPASVLIGRVKANRTHFQKWDHGKNLKDRVAAKGSDLDIGVVRLETPAECDQCPLLSPENNSRIRSAARNSDLVAVGAGVSNLSSLTANEAFIFTDSEFKINEIWKGAVSPGVFDDGGTSDEITITAPGGERRLVGTKLRQHSRFVRPCKSGIPTYYFLNIYPTPILTKPIAD